MIGWWLMFEGSGAEVPPPAPPPGQGRGCGLGLVIQCGGMKIALAQINTTVGNIAGNVRLMRGALQTAGESGANVILFPEMSVLGYPPRDLLYKEGVVEQCEEATVELAREFAEDGGGDILMVVPGPHRNDREFGTGVSNALALCRGGVIEEWYEKRLLPTYDVFDEKRYFDAGTNAGVIEHGGKRIGLTICEDLWIDDDYGHKSGAQQRRRRYAEDTIDELKSRRVDLILNASASPFRKGLPAYRRRLFHKAAKRAGVGMAYTNLVGGNDDLIFDGHSGFIHPDAGCVFEMAGFLEGVEIVDTDLVTQVESVAEASRLEKEAIARAEEIDLHEIYCALTLGVRDYLRKCGFETVWIALSGGIDSALVATIATTAIGKELVHGVALPSRYSSEGSVEDARELAKRLGIGFEVIDIEPGHEAMAAMLTPVFAASGNAAGVAEENVQARLRGNLMMGIVNKYGSLLLTTGNKSELAVGYCTMYGDMAGGLAVISDVPKTTVYALSMWINHYAHDLGFTIPPIPVSTITKPPSAELRPGQKDSDSLPPYEILDEIILRYVERAESVRRIIEETGFDAETVKRMCRLIDRNEYKRRQMPTGLKVTSRAFGSGWRMPIAAKFNGGWE